MVPAIASMLIICKVWVYSKNTALKGEKSNEEFTIFVPILICEQK